jgi:hypothetical protein
MVNEDAILAIVAVICTYVFFVIREKNKDIKNASSK